MKLSAHCQHAPRASSEAGLTLIESIAAIVVVAILVVAIGPVIAFSTATRIQARRIEWGTQAARSYLDGVRSGTITPPPIAQHNPTGATGTARLLSYVQYLNAVAVPPNGNLNCDNTTGPTGMSPGYCTAPAPTNTYALYCIDGDGDGQCRPNLRDFVVQASGVQRDNGTISPERGYFMAIRVYRTDGFQGSEPLRSSTSTERAREKTAAGGLGARKLPIFETILEVTPGSATFNDIRNRLN